MIVLKGGALVWASRVCGYEEFSSSSVCALDLLSTNMAEEDNWGTWSAASPPGVAAPTMPATSAPTMPSDAAQVVELEPTSAPTMPAEAAQVEELDPQTTAVESVLFWENPRLHVAVASLVATAPRPPMGAMKGGSIGRIAARSWDQASEASSSREIDRNLNRLPDPIAELSPLAYRMYAKVGPETTRLVGRALERYNKMLMLDYSEEIMEPKETPFIPCWTALERCLEEDLAEAKKMEESAGDFVEDIFGPIYSCTPKKESGDSASVGCLTEDLEEQTNRRLNRIRLGLFLGKINVGNAEALESLRPIRSHLGLEDLHGCRLMVGSTNDLRKALVGDLEEARKDPQFSRRMSALEDSLRAGSLPRCLGIFVQGMIDAGGIHPLQRNTTSSVPELGVNTKAFLVRSLQKVMSPREPAGPPAASTSTLPPVSTPITPASAEQMQAAGYGAVGIHPPVEPPLPRGIGAFDMDTAFGRGASFCPSSGSKSESEGVLQDEAPTASTFDNPYGDVQESACLGLQTRPDFGGPGWRRRWWSITSTSSSSVECINSQGKYRPISTGGGGSEFPWNRSQRYLRYLRGLLRVLLKGMKLIWKLWDSTSFYVANFVWLVFIGVCIFCAGPVSIFVLLLYFKPDCLRPNGPGSRKANRKRRLLRKPCFRMQQHDCWKRYPGCRTVRSLRLCLVGRVHVMHFEHGSRVDSKHFAHVLGMMVAGLPVVVNVDSEEGGPRGSEPELPPEKKSRSSSSNNPEPSGPNDESREEAQEVEAGPRVPPEGEVTSVPLTSRSLRDHQCQGHQPYISNCDSCLCSRGRVPARRAKDSQKMSSVLGMDYLFFGKLRVLLIVHEMSRYLMAVPIQDEARTDPRAIEAIGKFIKEVGLQNRSITLRCDNENLLLAFGNHLSGKAKQLGVERVIVDQVPGYRPQAKGGVERQVAVVKQAFWANWLSVESEISRKGSLEEPLRLPLGGLLWRMCLLYVSRTINLFMSSPGDAATPIDLVHDEICSRPKTLPFGCLCACQIAGRRLMKKYRGRKLLRCIYLGPSQPRGGGVFAIALGEREVELFPACRGIIENDRFVFLKEELIGIAGEDRRILDVVDPERPINFSTEPSSAPKRPLPIDENLLEDEGEEEELIPDVVPGSGPGRNPELGYDPEHGFSGPPSEGDHYEPSLPGEPGGGIDADGDTLMEEDIEAVMIDLLIHESLMKVYKGPDARYLCSVGSAKTLCFDVPFCGAKVRCYVPDNAVSETNGERLDPQLLEKAMRLELEELESFKVGTVVSEEMAKKVARTNGRRILTSRWVNTIKKPGLYRARLVVRDFASFGASTLQEGIYSPTTTLEGLRLLLALVSESGSLISGDVSVAFMHADCARVEVIQMPNNVVLAKGGVVYVQLKKAVNGLRSAPLSWYREISSYLESIGLEQVIDPTIYRRFTKDSKGKVHLSIVLFYVDDILVWSQLPGEAKAIFGLLSKKYKLKQTGIIEEHRPGEVSFLGRRIFRTKACEGSNVIFFGLDPHYLEGCCTEFQIKKGTTKLPSLERLVREFERKGPSERLTPEAHDRFRRVLGKLAWSSLTRPDLAFVVGYLERFQAAPTEAAEHAMRATLRWVLGLPPMVQRFPSERVSLKNECDPREITLFVDASWSLDSTSGGIVSWMNCYLKAYSRKQPTTSLSSAEAELLALTEGAKEAIYISLLVEQLLEGVQGDTGTYPIEALCDSQAAICISNMNSLLRKVRHLELRAQYIQEQVSSGRLRPSFLPGKENPADGLTKSPTEDMLWSMYEATGLVQWPELTWDNSRRVEFGDEEVVEVEAFDLSRIRIPDEWLESATKVAITGWI